MDVEAEIDRLYGLPLGEFTAARDDLAKRLRASKDGDGARRVKRLKKPSVAVWALNQLPRVDADGVSALLEASEALRRAQRKAVSGGKNALREAQAERKRTVDALVKRAESVLTDAGHAASRDALAKITDSLMAVATDSDGAELFAGGRLSRELEPAGFVDVGGLSVMAGETEEPAAEPTAEEASEEAEDDAERRRALDAARRRAEEASRAAVAAERDALRKAKSVEDADRKAAEARAHVEEAERLAAKARDRARELEALVTSAKEEAEQTGAEAERRREEAEAAAQDLSSLEGGS